MQLRSTFASGMIDVRHFGSPFVENRVDLSLFIRATHGSVSIAMCVMILEQMTHSLNVCLV
jgi:hypothetical protein